MKKKIYIDITYGKNKKTKAYILDISKTGIGVASTVSIRKDTLINVIPRSDDLVALKGKVARVVKIIRKYYNYRLGVKFMFLNDMQKKSLNEFISHLEKRKFYRLEFI